MKKVKILSARANSKVFDAFSIWCMRFIAFICMPLLLVLFIMVLPSFFAESVDAGAIGVGAFCLLCLGFVLCLVAEHEVSKA